MANIKISDMTPGAALTGTEKFEMVQSAATFSGLASQIRTYCLSAPIVVTEAVGSSALTLTGATQTTSQPVLNATQTWNAGGVTFTGLKLNVTNTASAAGSMLVDLLVGGLSKFNVDKNGLIAASTALFSGVVGSSTITVATATQTTSQPILDLAQTWNAGGVTFTGLKTNITDTASAAASMLLDLQVGGTTQYNVSKAGAVTQVGSTTYTTATAGPTLKQGANGRVGTFVLNGTTPVTVNNTSIAITDAIIMSLNTVGGTVGAAPVIKTITAGVGFTVAGTASDSSTINYLIIKSAA